MKTIKVVGLLLKGALAVGAAAIIAKIALTWHYGYRNVDTSYGGAYFYNWRAKYMDHKLAKSKYEKNKPNEQPAASTFLRYYDMVEGTNIRHVTGKDPKTGKAIYGPKRTEYPYYAYEFPDTFVMGPKNTWKLFKGNPRAMDLEMKFLQFRGRFISEMNDIDFSLKNPYFEQPAPPNETAEQKRARTAKVGKGVKKNPKATKADLKKVQGFFMDPTNQDFINVPLTILPLFEKVRNRVEGYSLRIVNNRAVMEPELEEQLMPVLQGIFTGFHITADKVNGFFTRLARVTVTPMDTHVLNRFYMLCFYMFYYVDPKKVGNKDFNETNAKLSKLKAQEKAAKQTGKKLSSDTQQRMKNLGKKTNQIKLEMILTRVSQTIGSMIGTRGIFLQNGGDQRGWLEWFGAPRVSKPKKFKGKNAYKADTNLLNKEFGKMTKKPTAKQEI